MSQNVNDLVVALSAGIPALILVVIISARKLADVLPREALAPVSRLRMSPLRFGWIVHFAIAFLFCSCILVLLSSNATGPSLVRGAIAGLIGSLLAFVFMPPLAETEKAEQAVERLKAWGISIPVLVIGGALLGIGYFAGSSVASHAALTSELGPLLASRH